MDERITCVGFRIGGWERLNIAERIRARLDVWEKVDGSGSGRPEVMLAAGDVSVFVFRMEPVEAVVTLVDVLRRPGKGPRGEGRQGTRISVTGGSSAPGRRPRRSRRPSGCCCAGRSARRCARSW